MATASSAFHNLIDQYDPFILRNFYRRDPFISMIPRTEFDTGQGLTPKVITHTGELPTSYMDIHPGTADDMATLNITDGPGSSGDVVATRVQTGQTERNYTLKVDAWKSDVINMSDMTFREDPAGAASNIYNSLGEYAIVKNSDWHRVHNIGMVDNKAVVSAAGVLATSTDSNFDHSAITVTRENTAQGGSATTITLDASASAVDDFYNGKEICIIDGTGAFAIGETPVTITDYVGATKVATVAAWPAGTPDATSVFRILSGVKPAATLDWAETLPFIYDEVERIGGPNFAVGFADGMAAYSLSVGPEAKRKLFKADLQVDIRYNAPNENFTARGISKAVNGFIPNTDSFPIRYDECFVPIYPTVNQATTTGQKFALNPDYKPVSLGGKALYEVGTVLMNEVYEARPRPVDQTSLDRANFLPTNYMAEVRWINNGTFEGSNDLQNKGYFRADWQLGAKPIRPELGWSVLYKIPSEV